MAAPYTPESVYEVVITLPDALKAIKRQHDAQLPDTSDQEAAVLTALSYLDLARTDDDPRWFGYAEASVMPWWNSASRSVQTGFIKVRLFQFRHEFTNALRELNRMIKLQPRAPKAFLARANVYTMLGNFDLALRDCRQLLLLGGSILGAHCTAQVQGLTGSGQQAIDTLMSLLSFGSRLSPDERFEIHLSLATIAHRHNDVKLAMEHYQQAYRLKPKNNYLLDNYSDLLIETSQTVILEDFLNSHSKPLYQKIKYLRLLRNSNPDAAMVFETELTQHFKDPLTSKQEFPHKDYAEFLHAIQGDPKEALSASLENWAIQREPSSALLVLKCALVARDIHSAIPVINWIKSTGLYDYRINALIESLNRMYTLL